MPQKRAFQPKEDMQEMTQQLHSWREEQSESQRRLDDILSSYTCSINKALEELLEEVGHLQSKLSAMTEERNGLLVAVNKLSGYQMSKLQIEPGDCGENNFKGKESDVQGAIEICDEDIDEDFIENGTEQNEQEQTLTELDKSIFDKVTDADDMEHASTEVDVDNGNADGGLKNDFVMINLRKMPLNNGHNESQMMEKLTEDNEGIIGEECSKIAVEHKGEDNHPFDENDEFGSSNLDNFADADINNLELVARKKEAYKNEDENVDHEETVDDTRHRKFLCDMCPYTSYNKTNVRNHIDAVHRKLRNHICEDCGYAASFKTGLRQHRETVHKVREERFRCELCPFKSYYRVRLKEHALAIHEQKEGNFKCDQCSYKSYRKWNLKAHIHEVHMNNKSTREKDLSFVCDQCSFKTHMKTLLTRHVETVHVGRQLKYKCQHCPYKSYRNGNLSRHIQDVHKII